MYSVCVCVYILPSLLLLKLSQEIQNEEKQYEIESNRNRRQAIRKKDTNFVYNNSIHRAFPYLSTLRIYSPILFPM